MQTENSFALPNKYRASLMGFAALWIFTFHLWIVAFEPIVLYNTAAFIKRIGFCGVDIFFFLSGVGLYSSVQKHSLKQFYARRFRRLVLPYLVVALAYCIVDRWTVYQLIGTLTGWYYLTVSINNLLWFVPSIAILYLLFPFYYKLFAAARNKTIFTLGVLAVWLAASVALRGTMRPDLYGFTNRIPVFCAGCLAGYLAKNKKRRFGPMLWGLLSLTLILGLRLSYLTIYRNMPLLVPIPHICVPNFLISVSVSYLLPKCLDLLGAVPVGRLCAKAATGVLGFYGMVSYELYCVQERLGEWMIAELTPRFTDFKYSDLAINFIVLLAITATGLALHLAQNAFWKTVDFSLAKYKGGHKRENAVS